MSSIRRPLAWILVTLALAASAACGGGASDAPPPVETPAAGEAETAAYLSERTMELWVVYNTYDLEGLRGFYEESYWLAEEEELRRNMAPFESRGVTFTAEETSPPRQIEPGKWELKHKVSFSGGSLSMKFHLRTIRRGVAAHLRGDRLAGSTRGSRGAPLITHQHTPHS